MNKKLLWLIPLALILAIAAAILALPRFVASRTHRGNIEAIASSLTGRNVLIGGKMSLNLLPGPQLTAADVTITGPRQEIITARSLTLGISVPALLHGRLSAKTLTLDAPVIAFPWPLPGGPSAIAPPGWLTALHARINNGMISLGAARFSNVAADVFTGASGSVTVSGTGTLLGHGISLKMALSPTGLDHTAPLAMAVANAKSSLRFSGRLNGGSIVSGTAIIATPQLTGTAHILADAGSITATNLRLYHNKAAITGAANMYFAPFAASATLNTQNLSLPHLSDMLSRMPAIPLSLNLNAVNLTLAGRNIPSLQTSLAITPKSVIVHALRATLPAEAVFTGKGQVSASGIVQGEASLTSPNLPALLSEYDFTVPNGWTTAQLSAMLSGSITQLRLTNAAGQIGNAHLTGNVILSPGNATGTLDFDRLDLMPLITWLGHRPRFAFSADGQITAAKASFGPIPLQHLLIDGALDGGLNIRRVSASVFGGLASGNLALDPAGQVTAARGFLSLPSAAPLALALPAAWQPPAALVKPRLNVAIFAEGKPSALSTSLVGTLGDFAFTAAPTLNLARLTATGPLTLRHPDAIAAMQIFGLSRGIAWPGPGSIAMRASFTAAPEEMGLTDFVLSLGALNAEGDILEEHGILSARIDADMLALPPVGASEQIPWAGLGRAKGKIALRANHVLYAGTSLLDNANVTLTLGVNAATLALAQAGFAGGDLSGTFGVALAANTPATLTATFSVKNIDSSQLILPFAFPYRLANGRFDASGKVTASGYSPKNWAATLGGTASLAANKGSLSGFNLAKISLAFTKQDRAGALRSALASGNSNFDHLSVGADFAHGIASLNQASLTGSQGSATATGNINFPDENIELHLEFAPTLAPPVNVDTMVTGSWAAPKQFPQLKTALAWKQPAPPP